MRVAANRANATKSCGPRTPAGKARAAQNARCHGLAGCGPLRPEELTLIKQLTQKLVPADSDDALVLAAQQVAESRVRLMNVRRRQAEIARRCAGEILFEEIRRTDRYLNHHSARFRRAVRKFEELLGRKNMASFGAVDNVDPSAGSSNIVHPFLQNEPKKG
jgi:hypothetical protein